MYRETLKMPPAFTALIFNGIKVHSELLNLATKAFSITSLHSAIITNEQNVYNTGKQVKKKDLLQYFIM